MNKEEFFDFGFTASDEVDLPPTKQYNDTDAKLKKMHKMVSVLLDNLLKDSDKPYLHWPNRKEKIEEFRKKLDALL